MPWEQRGNSGRYYYKSYRTEDGKVRKRYFGNGEKAQRESMQDHEKKALKDLEEQMLAREQARTQQAVHLTAQLETEVQQFLELILLTHGYWRGNNNQKWRKRRECKE